MGARDENDKTSIFNRWKENDVEFLDDKEKEQKNSEKKTNNSKEDT